MKEGLTAFLELRRDQRTLFAMALCGLVVLTATGPAGAYLGLDQLPGGWRWVVGVPFLLCSLLWSVNLASASGGYLLDWWRRRGVLGALGKLTWREQAVLQFFIDLDHRWAWLPADDVVVDDLKRKGFLTFDAEVEKHHTCYQLPGFLWDHLRRKDAWKLTDDLVSSPKVQEVWKKLRAIQ